MCKSSYGYSYFFRLVRLSLNYFDMVYTVNDCVVFHVKDITYIFYYDFATDIWVLYFTVVIHMKYIYYCVVYIL